MRSILPALLILLALAAVLRVEFFFTVLYFLVGVFVLARLWLQRSSGNLKVERRFVDRAFAGEEVPVEVVVRNSGLLPIPWLQVREATAPELTAVPFDEQVVSLGPHDRRVF